jgi:carbonic anhydrase
MTKLALEQIYLGTSETSHCLIWTAMKICMFSHTSHIALALHGSMVMLFLSGHPALGASIDAPTQRAAPSGGSMPIDAASAHASGTLTSDIQKALKDKNIERKKVTLAISDPPTQSAKHPSAAVPRESFDEHGEPAMANSSRDVARSRATTYEPASRTTASRKYIKARAAALNAYGSDHSDVHWSYSGMTGPQAWGQLKPEFITCGIGKRQSPINIETSTTLQGPAEPLQFNYRLSDGTVVNNGHSIQVDLPGDNTLTVRGSVYKLLQLHFHSPSEEQVDFRNSAMVVHLVHKSAAGNLAVVAVMLEPGVSNPLIDKVWTYMPLDVGDRVRMPDGVLDVNALLPKDQRYYQFMGSLTTPPCTEGVLWMVLKQAVQMGQNQLRLFQQIYPQNARPVQPTNGRLVRDAQ